MKRVLAWAGAIFVGLALGAASAFVAPDAGRRMFDDEIGAWSYSRAADAPAGPYSRAIVARDGLMALSAREALSFTLDRDENGLPLQETCIYEMVGEPIAARWWSLTLYGRDHYLARNSDHAASLDASRAAVSGRGRWVARISPVRGEAINWLSSREARRGFSLTLRIYNPRRDFVADAASLPSLRTLSCPGAGA